MPHVRDRITIDPTVQTNWFHKVTVPHLVCCSFVHANYVLTWRPLADACTFAVLQANDLRKLENLNWFKANPEMKPQASKKSSFKFCSWGCSLNSLQQPFNFLTVQCVQLGLCLFLLLTLSSHAHPEWRASLVVVQRHLHRLAGFCC